MSFTTMTRERDLSSLASALNIEDSFIRGADVLEWLASASEKYSLRVEQIPFGEFDQWHFRERPLRIAHRTGRFFTVEGIRTATDFGPVRRWDQPIINQPEIGILGILTKVSNGVRYYLMQAKVEPGNINGAQLSPTLQATHSNYLKVHRGRQPEYLEYFTGGAPARVIVDQLQTEQGSRFLCKRNRTLIVEPEDEVPERECFRWMTLGQIKSLLRLDNIVNMDARSVLSSIPLPSWEVLPLGPQLTSFGFSLLESARSSAHSAHTMTEILNWFSRMQASYTRRVTRRGLDRIDDWILSETEIRHRGGGYFSVIGVHVEGRGREVARWTQPLLSHPGRGLNGMVTQRVGGVLHFLIRACFYPGNLKMFELGSTVSRSDYVSQFKTPAAPQFLDLFHDPSPDIVRFSSVQSEEGGRFFHYQNQYMILELPEGTVRDVPEEFMWMTLGQIQELMPHGYFNIEARNLLACLHLM